VCFFSFFHCCLVARRLLVFFAYLDVDVGGMGTNERTRVGHFYSYCTCNVFVKKGKVGVDLYHFCSSIQIHHGRTWAAQPSFILTSYTKLWRENVGYGERRGV